ncbi:radical SAM protein [Patescibacteria group bacterium]|nr:radical SAM protein [Patescibacteria group bacterium]
MFSKLILPLTTRCNLNCRYCYVDKRGSKSLPLLLAKKAINFLIRNNKNKSPHLMPAPLDSGVLKRYGDKKVSLIFAGGEPLLEWKKMKYLILYAIYQVKKSNVQIETIGFPTNGLLLNEKILLFCRRNNIKVGVSADGACNYRKTIKGRDSFALLRKKFPLFVKFQDVLRIRMTIAPEYAGKLFFNFKKLLKEGFFNIDMQPAIGLRWPNKFRRLYLNNLKKFLEIVKERETKRNERFFVKHLQDFVAGRRDKYRAKDWQTVLMDLDGSFYPCEFFLAIPLGEREKYAIGHISRGLNFNLAKNYKAHKTCFKICLRSNFQKRKFDPVLIRDNLRLLKGIEKIYTKYQHLISK